MTRGRDTVPGVVAVALTLAVAALAATVWLRHGGPPEPHRAALRVVAPGVVADSVAGRANALPGRPFDAFTSPDAASARLSVAEGRSSAVLVVDLASAADTLYVTPASGSQLNASIARRVRDVEGSLDRVLVVRSVSDRGSEGPAPSALVASWLVLGFLTCVVISFVRGPVATTPTRNVVQVAVVVGVSAGLGLVTALVAARWYPGHLPALWLLGALTIFTAGMLTLALEGLAGYAGLALAALLVVLVGAPLFGGLAPLLQPEPWASLTPWGPHGASLQAATQVSVFTGSIPPKPLLVLVAWSVLALLTTVLARSSRAAAAGQDTAPLQHGATPLP